MTFAEPAYILLVDDDEPAVELALTAFDDNAFRGCVRVARTAADALELLVGDEEGCSPRIVLLGDGIGREALGELIARIRSDWRTSTLPIVLLETAAGAGLDALTEAPGGTVVIAKPLDFEEFLAAAAKISLFWRMRRSAVSGARR